jgi:tetratricopeptide (TPR) repeat protein
MGRYEEAARAFDKARQIGVPWRMTLYQFGPFEAYYNVGRYDDVMALVNANLNNGGEYVEETYYWQGQVEAAEGQPQRALQSFKTALAHNPRFAAAQEALDKLKL